MSVVVAFKYKDGIIIGADKRVSFGNRLREDGVSKITPTAYSGHCMGTVGLLRHSNLISIKDELMDYVDILEDTPVTIEYVIACIIPNLKQYFINCKAISEDGMYMESQILYATRDKIFIIGGDFSVMEYPLWAAMGCGEEMVAGVLNGTKEEKLLALEENDAVDLMEDCIARACKSDSMVSEDCDIILLTDKEEEKIDG